MQYGRRENPTLSGLLVNYCEPLEELSSEHFTTKLQGNEYFLNIFQSMSIGGIKQKLNTKVPEGSESLSEKYDFTVQS